jgi:hypothetical protein
VGLLGRAFLNMVLELEAGERVCPLTADLTVSSRCAIN